MWGIHVNVTLQELYDNIRLTAVIEDTNVTDAELLVIINQGMHEISVAFPWPWLEATANVSLTASTRTVALPADFDFAVVLIDDDNDNTLPYVSAQEFFKRTGNDTDNTATDPDFFTIFNDLLYFSPIPSANDTNRFTLVYYKTVTELALVGDIPAFHDAYHWMLVEYALWKLYNREEYFTQSERAFITYARYLNDMMSWYANRIKHSPFMWGDGQRGIRRRDPNIPLLNDY